jgi:hypothetical protein
MQAPTPLRVRMFEAAITDNVPELERLRNLNMADKLDYRAAFQCAIARGSASAAMHLWQSARRVPCMTSYAHLPFPAQLFVDATRSNRLDSYAHLDVQLARLALESHHSLLVYELANQEPRLILDALRDAFHGTDYTLCIGKPRPNQLYL